MIWKKRNQIFEGAKNKIFKKHHVEEISAYREKICYSCSDFDKDGEFCIVPKTGPCCKLCGCCLSFKTRALSDECPREKWSSVVTIEEEEIINENIN